MTTTACAGGSARSDTAVKDGVAAYERGDYATALRLMRPLADQGDTVAQSNLGVSYDDGLGVPQDFVLAYMWFDLAAARFPASAAEDRNQAVADRDLTAKKMTPVQIAEAERLAREWKPKNDQQAPPFNGYIINLDQ